MAVTPVIANQAVQPLVQANDSLKTNQTSDSGTSFKDILQNAINQVSDSESLAQQGAIDIATGNTDDLHTVMINTEKADLSLEALVQVRNKALDAYNEIMRMSL